MSIRVSSASIAAVLSGASGVTHAQPSPAEEMHFTIQWDKAIILPGEANTGAVYATFTPIGTKTQWNTPPGTGQEGTVKAFASTFFDLKNTMNGTNGQLSWTTPPELYLAGPGGQPDGNGGIQGNSAGQIGPPANTSPMLDNPIKVLDVKWVAGATFTGDVEYLVHATSAKVFLDVAHPSGAWVGETCMKFNGQGGFTVLPAPGLTIIPLVVAAWSAQRERRR